MLLLLLVSGFGEHFLESRSSSLEEVFVIVDVLVETLLLTNDARDECLVDLVLLLPEVNSLAD